jgi:uncharacterized protein YceK
MKTRALATFASAVLMLLTLSGCGAVYGWNKAAQSVQIKKANTVLLESCESGNLEACSMMSQSQL